jgi:hypothetical protein
LKRKEANMEDKRETKKTEWNAPDFEEVTLNCEVAAYAPVELEPEKK